MKWTSLIQMFFLPFIVLFKVAAVLPYAIAAFVQGESIDEFCGFVDPLTGLLNRRAFNRDIQRIKHPVGVLFIDLDNFKSVNNTLGHLSGDFYLQDVANALKGAVDGFGSLYRIGGDEIVVIARENVNLQAFEKQVVRYIKSYYGYPLSIGSATDQAHTVLQIADHKMYATKKSKKSEAGSISQILYLPSSSNRRNQLSDRRNPTAAPNPN